MDGSDTEDEIERIQAQQQKEQKTETIQTPQQTKKEIEDLLEDFFEKKTFHLDTVLDFKDRELLTRYIVAYGG